MNEKLKSPVRHVISRVELFNGSTLQNTFYYDGDLISWRVERVGEDSKFFGYGICQKCNVKIMDIYNEYDFINTGCYLNIQCGFDNEYINCFPWFKVTEVHRDKKTNELSITGYDLLYKANQVAIPEAVVNENRDYFSIAVSCMEALNNSICGGALPWSIYQYDYSDYDDLIFSLNGNFEGTETVRDVLDDVAEATNSIYFLDDENTLTFKQLDETMEPFEIDKSLFFEMDVSTNRRLSNICHATELGDNVESSTGESGTTQYIRDNAFLELNENIGEIMDYMVERVGGLTINQFDTQWRGNFLLKIGDRLALTNQHGTAYSFLLNDTIEYNGALNQRTQWNYSGSEAEDASNPSTLGEMLKQTYAKVDKVNKEINLVVSDKDAMKETVTQIQLDTDSITSSVQRIETNMNNSLESIEGELESIKNRVESTLTAEDIQFKIEETISNMEGADSVTTTTGFTFNNEGLTISKSDSEMSTIVTEDGMVVYRNGEEVLVANNKGVDAANLHATTYLIIGMNSRFEDYDNGARTGCFWIGS